MAKYIENLVVNQLSFQMDDGRRVEVEPDEATTDTLITLVTSTAVTGGEAGVVIDGKSSVPATGYKGYVSIPYSGAITGWKMFADVAGSAEVDVWKCAFADYPPEVTDSICGSNYLTLTSEISAESTTWSGSVLTVDAGDVIGFNLNSISTIKKLTALITITKT